jgi:hypothetical protein
MQLTLEEARLERSRTELRGILQSRCAVLQLRDDAQAAASQALSVWGSDLATVERVRESSIGEERRLADRAAGVQRVVQDQERTLIEARRRVRLLERLRERRGVSWRADFDKELDELAAESAIAQWRRSP